jgi:antitoxin (DNA-binding transcriptional repressor) of toxin-antitoxin stability system
VTVTLEEAQAKLPELIRGRASGEAIDITEGGVKVATIILTPPASAMLPRQLGALRGTVLTMEHFDDPIEGMEEYA